MGRTFCQAKIYQALLVVVASKAFLHLIEYIVSQPHSSAHSKRGFVQPEYKWEDEMNTEKRLTPCVTMAFPRQLR